MDTEHELAKRRTHIDDIDRQLVDLLNQRTNIAHQIGYIKKEARLPILELSREEKVLANVAELNRGPLTAGALHNIFAAIMKEMRKIQEDPMGPPRDH